MDTEEAPSALERVSIDTSVNINEDVALASEYSSGSRNKHTESVFSNLRTSLDGGSSHIGDFNILKHVAGQEGEASASEYSSLGPNSIFDLTQALDISRVKSNKALKSQVTINGGTQTFYNLIKPSTSNIPPIQLQSLNDKVSTSAYREELITKFSEEYKSFESSYKSLTTDVLSSFSQSLRHEDTSSRPHENDLSEEESTNEVPAVFEDPNFRLDDQRVFRQVMEHSKIVPDSETTASEHIVNNSEVQEKLSHYLDHVEMQLIDEISRTSDSFFTTLGDIQNIKSQSQACVNTMGSLKSKFKLVEESQAKAGMKILDLIDENQSVEHLRSSLLQLKHITEGVKESQQLFESNKNLECLDKIVVTENLIHGVEYDDYPDIDTLAQYPKFEYPLVDVHRLPALKTRLRTLEDLKNACSKGYITDFLNLLIDDLRVHYKSVPYKETINRIKNTMDRSKRNEDSAFSKAYLNYSPELKSNLQMFIKNLSKSGYLLEAFSQYQDMIITEIKTIIRQGLPKGSDATDEQMKIQKAQNSQESSSTSRSATPVVSDNKDSSLASNPKINTLSGTLKSLSDAEFLEMIEKIFATLSECLRRLTVHQKLLLDLSLTSLTPEASKGLDVISLDITVAINKAIEITQVRLVKVLNVRSEQLGDLSVSEYLKMYSLSSVYLSECESINPGFNGTGPGGSLNEWVKNHVGYYVHRFHSNSVKRLAGLCDREVWREYCGEDLKQAQMLISKIESYASLVKQEDTLNWLASSQELLQIRVAAEEGHLSNDQSGKNVQEKLEIYGEMYFVPRLIVSVVRNVVDYIVLSKTFNSRANVILHNFFTFIKVLNSRILIAILNAGATRTAGLKHITTKHLALCIQTIKFMIAFIECVQNLFRTGEIGKARQSEAGEELSFDTCLKDFQEHRSELFSKLVSIMKERTSSHCAAIKSIDFSKPTSSPQQCHTYMEVLVKETMTVAKVLGKYLSDEDCVTIMSQIFDNYKRLLVNCFCAELPQLKDLNEKHSILKDIDYFRVKLGELNGYGNSGQVIWENVNSLPTLEESRMEEIMRNNIEGERNSAAASKENLVTTNIKESKISEAEAGEDRTDCETSETTTKVD